MKYTNHLANVNATQGPPNMTAEAFSNLMNVVFLEAQEQAYYKLKIAEKNPDLVNKYDIWISESQRRIDAITEKQEPKQFLKRILSSG